MRTTITSLCFVICLSLRLINVNAQDATPAVGTPPAAVAAPAAVAPAGADAGAAAAGEAVFKANCKQCHAINDIVVGPALKDAHTRWPSEAALLNFIKYPQKTIDGGNAYAKGLYDKYKQYMPNHDNLSDGDIKNVIAWIKAESSKPAETATAAAPGGASETSGSAPAADGSLINIVLIGMLLVIGLIVVVLFLMINFVTKVVSNSTEVEPADREYISQKINWKGMFASNAFKFSVCFVFAIIIGKSTFDTALAIGVSKGYAPKQPIPFSHKLHAGMYEIDCNYCHTGVNKGKSATIPSVNICMNCHNAIKTESPNIKLIWNAVQNNKPIEWVRVHNLPDLAYFNHAQHVKVGKIECTTCHGPVNEMEVVEQYSSLTMGWCINCHRETVVKADGNAYYDKLLKLHNETKGGDMHVADIGGLECSKCHY